MVQISVNIAAVSRYGDRHTESQTMYSFEIGMYQTFGCIQFRQDMQPPYTIRFQFLTVKKPDNKIG